ncbi:MAG: DAK2 domain-containing protein, partial [Thermoleophilaceae bacterium]|nr:DAK2 domain-containing protein [Thermoleophilaceae bacterium]
MPDASLIRFRRVVASACDALEERRQEINDLNVFPVADGDTGDNMARTLRAVVEELDSMTADGRSLDEIGRDEIVQAVARAALLGARGNSGVILSQIVRGLAEEFASRPGEPINPSLVAAALGRASDAAYAAVREPAEGTMLTVIREVAHRVSHEVAHMDAADAHIPPGSDDALQDSALARLMFGAIVAGQDSVRRTTDLLPALKEAGVVDSGGYGMVVIMSGIAAALAHDQSVVGEVERHVAPVASGHIHVMEDSDYRYCTNFAVTGTELDASQWHDRLEERGDSVLVVGDATTLRVHLHTDEPQAVIALFSERGDVIDVEIEDMFVQTQARNERVGHHDVIGALIVSEAANCGLVAVASGAGIARLFASLGASVVDGGPTLNPSTKELLAAIEAAGQDEIVLLPNSSNVILAAEHAAKLSPKSVVVVPVTSQQASLSAALAFDPAESAEKNAQSLGVALSAIRAGGVAPAARDDVEGRFSEGEAVGFVDDVLVAWG